MSPELEALLDRMSAKAQAEQDAIAATLDRHRMAYRTTRSALRATSNLTRARQL